jgi:hypothetical protein
MGFPSKLLKAASASDTEYKHPNVTDGHTLTVNLPENGAVLQHKAEDLLHFSLFTRPKSKIFFCQRECCQEAG